jgi:hypothetical protein
VIDKPNDLTARKSSACRNYCLPDGKSIDLRKGSIHAIKRDEAAFLVAHSDAYDNVKLLSLCKGGFDD